MECNGVVEGIKSACFGILSILEPFSSSSFAINSTDNFWHNANNWRSTTVPTDSSYAIIPSFANNNHPTRFYCPLQGTYSSTKRDIDIQSKSQLNVSGKE